MGICKKPCKWQGNHGICIICEETGKKAISKSAQDAPKIAKHGREGITAGGKVPKYRNRRFERDGEKYNSEKEYRRHQELKSMENAGEIWDLRREFPYELAGAVVLAGRRKPAIRYYADFVYSAGAEDGKDVVVEDVKSPITRKNPVFRIKKHLMKSVFGIDIQEF